MSSDNKEINSRKRFNEIIRVAKENKIGDLIKASSNRKSSQEGQYDDDLNVAGLRNAMEQLGPAYIKLGQMLCTRPDLVGKEVAEDLKKLRDDTKTTPFDQMKEVIESQLGKSIDEVYSEFEEEPLGSASIGQVYRATLKESGEEVAVKVQKPGIYDIILADVKIMKSIAQKADKYITKTRTYNLPAMVKEFERSIFKELDYMEEVMNMMKVTHNFEEVDYIKIPKVYNEYCNDKLITMELMKGFEVTKLFNEAVEGIDAKQISDYAVESYFKQLMIDGFFHADPHPGNLMITEDNKLCYMDWGMVGILNEEFRSNLAQLILLLLDGNSNSLIKQLTYMKIITPEQNTEELRMDIDDLLNRYMGADLNQMDGILGNLINTMIKHNVILPREFVMIGRGIGLIEDTGNKLNPEFNAASELERLSKKMVLQKLQPGNLVSGGFNYIVEIEHLLKDLPDRLNSTLNKIEKGEIEVNINHHGLNEFKNQLTVSLIISALIIGSSLAILADKGPKMFEISVIGLWGFIISAVLGIYIIIKYMLNK